MRAACKRWGVEPVTQRTFGFGEGDCWTACIATITGVSRDALEPVHQAYLEYARLYEARQYRDAYAALELCRRALRRLAGVFPVYLHTGDENYRVLGVVPRGLAIAAGQAARGLLHSVVVHDGALIWDPHPDRSGLSGAVESYDILLPVLPDARDRDVLA